MAISAEGILVYSTIYEELSPLGLWPKSVYDLLDATLHERTHLRGTFAYNTPERHLPLIFYPLFWLRCSQNARGVLAPINLNAPVWGLN